MGGSNDLLTMNLQKALQAFAQMRIQDIKDIRSVDTDLLLVFQSGPHIIWREGALTALQQPEMVLLFKDGTLKAEQLFKQIEMIHLNDLKGEDDSFFDGAHWVPYADAMVHPFETGTENRWIVI
jgi:hypothetical protein